jgi:hypothetical protein
MLAIVKLSYLLVYSNRSLARVMLKGELFYFINVKKYPCNVNVGVDLIWTSWLDGFKVNPVDW